MTSLLHPFSPSKFQEMDAIEALIARAGSRLRHDVVCEVSAGGSQLPVHCLELGSTASDVPAIGFFGGVHGVERIGTQVLLAFLHALIERLNWDETFGHMLERLRLVFVPLVNPGGMLLQTRCNPNGVDLMRNAPIEGDRDVSKLLGGQRLSPRLPWYRGKRGAPMEPEAQALCRVVEERLHPHPFSLTLDCHSGFGSTDRIWFPYARTRTPIEALPEIYALRTLFRSTHPYHNIYIIEPQSRQYTTHGDLWDHLCDRARAGSAPHQVFIPLTLEMGSWMWVRKSPGQALKLLGMFNPLVPHRHQRALRRHLTFLEFLLRAAISHERWRPSVETRPQVLESALAYWYRTPTIDPATNQPSPPAAL
ncbi:MAG: M14 family zinc carboxypeptidase [Panacagrimonas sp.]